MIEELGRELTRVGIRGRRRDRILAEFADHLACDPNANLGHPRRLAEQFADELATDAARRTALRTFGALVLTAMALVGAQASRPVIPDIADGRSLVLAALSAVTLVIGSQVAFVAASLALLRALRHRRVTVLPAEEVRLLRRRIAVAFAAGAVTAAGSALYAFNVWNFVPRWWSVLAVAAAGAAVVPLAGCAVAYARAAPLAVSKPGTAGGLSADLGALARPRLIGASAVLVMLVATSALEGSLIEGALRATFEAVAFTACFFALRRPLALTG